MRNKRIQKRIENHGVIVEPGLEQKEAFKLRPRDKSREIVPTFGLKIKPKLALNRIFDKAYDNSLISNTSFYNEKELKNISSGKEILPRLHSKTHFKGASTLTSDIREIKNFYNDAKLRSRFKTLQKSIAKSHHNLSQSVEPRNHNKLGRLYMYEMDSSVQYDSNNTLMVNGMYFYSFKH